MEPEFWLSQLGRLYREVSTKLDGTGSQVYAQQFNELLEKLQENHPDNQFVQEMEEVYDAQIGQQAHGHEYNEEVRLKSAQLADAIGYDLPEATQADSELSLVTVESHHNTEQTVNQSQSLSFDQTIQMVDILPRDSETKEELRAIVDDFQDELDKKDPDESRLRQFLTQAESKSTEIAANLAMLALKKGLTGVLDL